MKRFMIFVSLILFFPLIAKLQTETVSVKIVDCGDDMQIGKDSRQTEIPADVNGNGSDDNVISYRYYSDTEPLIKGYGAENGDFNSNTYDYECTNTKLYGGAVGYFYNSSFFLTEVEMNRDHARRDDYNLMAQHGGNGSKGRIYGLWYWKKEDFLNGGANGKVTFDSTSWVSVHISRYYTSFDGGRWVIKDGNQFYISDSILADNLNVFVYDNSNDSVGFFGEYDKYGNKITQTSYTLCPEDTKWAEYNPSAPYNLDFFGDSAVFQNHTFDSVTAVGWFAFKNQEQIEAHHWIKWYAFEARANVTRSATQSYYTDVSHLSSGNHMGQSISEFYMTEKEVTYSLWKLIWKWAVSNQYCRDIPNSEGHVFFSDGDMGSMDMIDNYNHSAQEPVTDITWYDAVLFCNALSKREGLTPCYYADAAKTQPLLEVIERNDTTQYGKLYDVYVDYTADGWRLPTMTEWSYAALDGTDFATISGDGYAWKASNANDRTHECGTKSANASGLYDIIGNVWEYVWDIPNGADHFDPGSQTSHTVLGGSFLFPHTETESIKPYGEIPYNGMPNIGFRIIRADAGIIPPPVQDYDNQLPSWEIKRDSVTVANTPPAFDSLLIDTQMVYLADTHKYGIPGDSLYEDDNLGFVNNDGAHITLSPFYMSRYEITYKQWNKIYEWAVQNGYQFNFDGDMGSMDWQTDSTHPRTPNQPVTDISWFDAALWCNALSEYSGLRPVYYTDSARTDTFKRALLWRNEMDCSYDNNLSGIKLFVHYDYDGYRLPTQSEWSAAYRANEDVKDHLRPSNASNNWVRLSSSGQDANGYAHDVGQLDSNAYGLYDLGGNVGEWFWDDGPVDYFHNHNPKSRDHLTFTGHDFYWALGEYGYTHPANAEAVSWLTREMPGVGRPHIGFRVVRCDSGEHSASNIFIPETLYKIDTANFDPLQGQTFHNNLMRTGEFNKSGIEDKPKAKWSFTTGGAVKSSPVVVGDTVVYIGSNDGYFYAINAETGNEVWKYQTGDAVRSTPTITDSVAYFGSDDSYFYAVYTTGTKKGNLKWKVKLTDKYGNESPIKCSPAVAYGLVFVSSHKYGFGVFDKETGKEVWKYKYNTSIALDGFEGIAIDGNDKRVYADIQNTIADWVNIETSIKKGRTAIGNGYGSSSPVLYNDSVIYFHAGPSVRAEDKKNEYDVSWHKRIWETGKNDLGNYGSSVAVTTPAIGKVKVGMSNEERLYVSNGMGTDANKVGIYCLDAENGTKKWFYNTVAHMNSSPALANNMVYCGCNDGKLYNFNAETGDTLWTFNTGGPVVSSPWVGDNVVYVGSDDGTVYALEPSNPTLMVNPDTISVSNDAGSAVVNVTNAGGGTIHWEAVENESWLSVTPDYGTDNGAITVNYDVNTGGEREGLLIISDTAGVAANSPDTVRIIQSARYTLTVVNGSGSGEYEEDEVINISTDAVPADSIFDAWTGDIAYLADPSSPSTTVTMPAADIMVTATYKPVPTYSLTVAHGSGGGDYQEDENVTIIADTSHVDSIFDAWTGDISYLDDRYDDTAVVTMPAQAITVRATYRSSAVPTYTLTVNDGTGGGDYTEGSNVVVEADGPAQGEVFDVWTGDTVHVADPFSSATSVTMPAFDISITANYESLNYTVTFTVLDKGAPVEGAVVEIDGQSDTTGDDGKVILDLPSGQFDFTINAEGYYTYNDMVDINGNIYMNVLLVPLGISDTKNNKISVFPNPANEKVNVSFSRGLYDRLKIISMVGETLMIEELKPQQEKITIDVKNMAGGIYIISLQNEQEVVKMKLIIE